MWDKFYWKYRVNGIFTMTNVILQGIRWMKFLQMSSSLYVVCRLIQKIKYVFILQIQHFFSRSCLTFNLDAWENKRQQGTIIRRPFCLKSTMCFLTMWWIVLFYFVNEWLWRLFFCYQIDTIDDKRIHKKFIRY